VHINIVLRFSSFHVLFNCTIINIRLDNRWFCWNLKKNKCVMTVDGTDCRISQPWPFNRSYNRKWYSHKFHKAGVRYEIGVCIETGWICWYYGPIPCGTPDLSIFRMKLKSLLGENECVLADRGYRGDSQCFTPYDAESKETKEMIGNALARHKTVNC